MFLWRFLRLIRVSSLSLAKCVKHWGQMLTDNDSRWTVVPVCGVYLLAHCVDGVESCWPDPHPCEFCSSRLWCGAWSSERKGREKPSSSAACDHDAPGMDRWKTAVYKFSNKYNMSHGFQIRCNKSCYIQSISWVALTAHLCSFFCIYIHASFK